MNVAQIQLLVSIEMVSVIPMIEILEYTQYVLYMTEDFLEFSSQKGNDLSTPRPEFSFPGLKEGDSWCLCAERWKEAYEFGKAPRIYLRKTHKKTLEIINIEILKEFALDLD